MRLPPADLIEAMQPFRAAVLRKRPELWPECADMDIHACARDIAARVGRDASQGETAPALLRRLTAELEAEPVFPALRRFPSVPAGASCAPDRPEGRRQ